MSALLGILIAIYSIVSLIHPKVTIPRQWEKLVGPLVGTINGVLTGMTGSFVFPSVLYLQAIRLPRDVLIQAMGIVFTASTVALAISLGKHNLLTMELGVISAASVMPALAVRRTMPPLDVAVPSPVATEMAPPVSGSL